MQLSVSGKEGFVGGMSVEERNWFSWNSRGRRFGRTGQERREERADMYWVKEEPVGLWGWEGGEEQI